MVKKALFFTIDALIATALVLSVIFLIPVFYVQKQSTPQAVYFSSDIIHLLSTLTLAEVNTSEVVDLMKENNVTNLSVTILEQALRLQVKGHEEDAKKLLNITIGNLTPNYYNAGIWMEGYESPLYATGQDPVIELISSKELVSGIERNRAVEGLTSRVFLTGINERTESTFVYFGGYVGDGNITQKFELPSNIVIDSAYMELDINNNFNFYVNGIFVDSLTPVNLDMRTDSWNISHLDLFGPGNNTIEFKFNGTNPNKYIGGGYFKVTYSTSDIVSLPTGTKRFQLPGISGVINLYDSFYVPGRINLINISLRLLSTAPAFLNIGGVQVIEISSSEYEQNVNLNNIFLSALLNYSFLSNKTVPFRLGLLNASFIGKSDSLLVTDRSSSMNIADTQIECSPYVYDSNPDGGCHELRYKVVQSASNLFVNTILNLHGNRVGLAGYGNRYCSFHDLDSDKNSLEERIFDESTGFCGTTCISCGIVGSTELLIENKVLHDTIKVSDEDSETSHVGGNGPVSVTRELEGTVNASRFIKSRLSILGKGIEYDDASKSCIFINGNYVGRTCKYFISTGSVQGEYGWHTCSYAIKPEWLAGFEVGAHKWVLTEKTDFEEGVKDSNIDIDTSPGDMILTNQSWWNNGWQKRIRIYFNNSDFSSFTDFPVLVLLNSSRIEYALTQNSGQDIRFVDADGTLLPHEIEFWNETGKSYIWVRIPRIDADSTSDFIWLYYGNDAASDAQDAAGVWNSTYGAVWHLNEIADDETSAALHLDSTANNNDGSQHNNGDINGVIGRAQHFDGLDDRITVPFSNTLNLSNKTYSFWARVYSNYNPNKIAFNSIYWENSGANAYFYNSSEVIRITYKNLSGTSIGYNIDNMRAPFGDWAFYSVVYEADGEIVKITAYRDGEYINGIYRDTGGIRPGALTVIGAWTGNWVTLNGSIDEFRISNTSRSADWIKAQYSSMNDRYLIYGNEESEASITYPESGTFVSPIHMAGGGVNWNSMYWSEILQPNTTISIEVRTGNSPIPDDSWDNYYWHDAPYSNSSGGAILQNPGRYIQLRATLITNNTNLTPMLREINISYDSSLGNNIINITGGDDNDCFGSDGTNNGWDVKDVRLSIWEALDNVNVSVFKNTTSLPPITTTRTYTIDTELNATYIKSAYLNFKASEIDPNFFNCVYVNNHYLGTIDHQRWSGDEVWQNITFDIPVMAINSSKIEVMVTAGGNTLNGDCFDVGPNSWRIEDVEVTVRSTNGISSYDNNMNMLVMTDGQANMIIGSSTLNTIPAEIEAVEKACDAHQRFGIGIYAVAFGDGANLDTVRDIACCDNCSHFFNSSTAEDLMNAYRMIATEINFRYKAQVANVTGNLTSVVYPESNIYVEYSPRSYDYGKLPITIESDRFGNNDTNGSFFVPPDIEVYDAKLTSYSGDRWTDQAMINDSLANWIVFYNLSQYGQDYLNLGDPYALNIPTELIQKGINNSIRILTATNPSDASRGSPDDRAIYTIGIAVGINYTGIFEKADGCIWHVEFDDGTTLAAPIPASYTGSTDCSFDATTDCSEYAPDGAKADAINYALCKLFEQLDFNNDGKLFITFDASNLDIVTNSMGKIPYMWGPIVAEVRVWR